ncbi:YeaC family protein [Gilvimarinus agarilyticus]|uniref:YeaC family protein n=1 Tax=unclassified Gilvimarinus TaxID=2642066 RepID=UPI001C085CDE|nr:MULTISPECIES: YeaC family protein [unclassified Gilvimarinus]MBU2887145.1 YeaC family protein [Gilvimarinus agarilyticus]MDO6571804.1 YeaC family protein [Gilvimarinus sp. 2_MG-2023]MDO6745877.1 YeaC family protein [Gilvimarinus sp. 1_MG-2023]
MNDNFQQVINNLTPDVYQNLKRAVELGKWPDGKVLTQEQRDTCMQAVIAYEHIHLPPEEQVGYIPPKPGDACDDETKQNSSEQPLKWK